MTISKAQAAVNRAEQLRAAVSAAIKFGMTGAYPPVPSHLNISQPRWQAMIQTVINHFINKEPKS